MRSEWSVMTTGRALQITAAVIANVALSTASSMLSVQDTPKRTPTTNVWYRTLDRAPTRTRS